MFSISPRKSYGNIIVRAGGLHPFRLRMKGWRRPIDDWNSDTPLACRALAEAAIALVDVYQVSRLEYPSSDPTYFRWNTLDLLANFESVPNRRTLTV